MTDTDAFLLAIRANPADDTVRLAFADFLDERGEPDLAARAEFIRVQIELARWGGCEWKSKRKNLPGYVDCEEWNNLLGEGRVMTWCGPCRRRVELRRRESDLLSKHALEWFAITPYVTWSRGFLSKFRLSWADCASHLDSILADPWVPGLDEVELTTNCIAEPIDSDGILWAFIDLPVNHRLHRMFFDITMTPGDTRGMRIDELMMRQAWPQVRSWKLPPEPREPAITTAARELLDAAQEIVRRAEMDVDAIRQGILPRGTLFWE